MKNKRKNETIPYIVECMTEHAKFSLEMFGCDQVNLRKYAARVKEAYERLPLFTPEQLTEIARQGSVIQDQAREIDRLKKVLDDVEDQVRWTIAHLECHEYDNETGALCTAGNALEYLTRAKGVSK